MANFEATPKLSAAPGAKAGNFSVVIDSAPTSVNPGTPFTIKAHTTGFSPGNWVNFWLKMPNGQQLDGGGMITTGDQIVIPNALLVTPGMTSIQLSVGTWPNEQWSTPVAVKVVSPATVQPTQMLKTAAIYHDDHGSPLILSAYYMLLGGSVRSATLDFDLGRDGGVVTQPITVKQGRWTLYTAQTRAPAAAKALAPGSPVDMDVSAWICYAVTICHIQKL